MQPCPTLTTGNVVPATDQNFLWTVNSTSTYNVTDFWGNCLETDPFDQLAPGGGSKFSTITVAWCNGSRLQMWNAPPTLSDAGVSNVFEPNASNGSRGPLRHMAPLATGRGPVPE